MGTYVYIWKKFNEYKILKNNFKIVNLMTLLFIFRVILGTILNSFYVKKIIYNKCTS
jgi:hypothetical protein